MRLQVDSILPLLKRGVGIHHGGLLPILKEVIEIMFQESLIKCLFATETFSMGINMPAKTVVFTATRKFDGRDFRWVSAGEYIQMSGRAGRRGLDDRGIVIQMVDEKMDPTSAKEMLRGQADPLNSTFHLGCVRSVRAGPCCGRGLTPVLRRCVLLRYNMLLNLMRVEGSDPEHLMALSFFQFQNEKVCVMLSAVSTATPALRLRPLTEQLSRCAVLQRAPALQAALDEKEAEIKAMVIKQEKDVAQLYTLSKHMDRIRNVGHHGAACLAPPRLGLRLTPNAPRVVPTGNAGDHQPAAAHLEVHPARTLGVRQGGDTPLHSLAHVSPVGTHVCVLNVRAPTSSAGRRHGLGTRRCAQFPEAGRDTGCLHVS